MTGNLRTSRLDILRRGREARHSHLAGTLRLAIPHQVRVLREQRNWTQEQLADECQKKQEGISRIERGTNASYTLKTLEELAKAFDVGLVVKFVPFSRFLEEYRDLSPSTLEADGFQDELDSQSRAEELTNLGDSEAFEIKIVDMGDEIRNRLNEMKSDSTEMPKQTEKEGTND